MNIQELYRHYASTESDINEHLCTLFDLATECDIITEFGTRDGCSTSAFAAAIEGTSKKLFCVDLYRSNNIDGFLKSKNITFYQADTLVYNMQTTDLLFIDTLHTYFQLFSELKAHSKNVKKYIAMHDTVSYGVADEPYYNPNAPVKMSEHTQPTDKKGLITAIDDFLKDGDGINWKIKKAFTNNNGLTVLERVNIIS
jgi:hypothetical protein